MLRKSPGVRSTTTQHGFTLLELIIATAILVVLSTMAVPLARLTIQRERERQLRIDLWEMRDAIDRYKDIADRGGFQIKVDSNGYPPDLETLVKGIDVQGKKIRFLRKLPSDPMTGSTEWGLRSMQDDPDSDSWGGQSVFDVYTKSQGTATARSTRTGKLINGRRARSTCAIHHPISAIEVIPLHLRPKSLRTPQPSVSLKEPFQARLYTAGIL